MIRRQSLTLNATPDSGISSATAPLPVTFTYQFDSSVPAQSLSLDFDGDGTFEITNAPPDTILSGGYSTPGIYIARLQVTDQQGQVSTAEVGIVVQSVVTIDALFKNAWNGINAALIAGDKTTALSFLTPRAREKYGPVFDALLPHMAEVVATFTAFQGVNVTSSYSESALNATVNGENRFFLVYFLKDTDGIWRLEAM